MSELIRLNTQDYEAARELIEAASNLVVTDPLSTSNSLKEIGLSGDCDHVADAVQTAAGDLGILVSQEMHLGHMVSVFSEKSAPPTPSDPILCMTWGQFLPNKLRNELKDTGVEPYFGERQGIKELVGRTALARQFNYGTAFSPASLIVRLDRKYDSEFDDVSYYAKHYKTKLAGFLTVAKILAR